MLRRCLVPLLLLVVGSGCSSPAWWGLETVAGDAFPDLESAFLVHLNDDSDARVDQSYVVFSSEHHTCDMFQESHSRLDELLAELGVLTDQQPTTPGWCSQRREIYGQMADAATLAAGESFLQFSVAPDSVDDTYPETTLEPIELPTGVAGTAVLNFYENLSQNLECDDQGELNFLEIAAESYAYGTLSGTFEGRPTGRFEINVSSISYGNGAAPVEAGARGPVESCELQKGPAAYSLFVQ